jgi:triacylglycerol esterase/lipase EstA (alpha/beta hydrolase family)
MIHLKAPKKNDKNEIVVLVHGLFLRSLHMFTIGRFLNKNGYEIYIYDYFSTRKQIYHHGVDFKNYLKRIFKTHPEKKVNIVTHSLGGIVTREAAAALQEESESDRLHRIVMLAPPNKGSDVAKNVVKYLPFSKWIAKPLPELSSSSEAYVHQAPKPLGFEIGIIAGKYDEKVNLEYTHIEGQKDHIIVPSRHSFIMFRKDVQKKTLAFLENGKF